MGLFTKVIKLFSGQEEVNNPYSSEDYKGFIITPAPIAEKGQFRLAGLIEKVQEEGQEAKQHQFIRSDMVANADQAADLTLLKCKVFIDQMGDNIFK